MTVTRQGINIDLFVRMIEMLYPYDFFERGEIKSGFSFKTFSSYLSIDIRERTRDERLAKFKNILTMKGTIYIFKESDFQLICEELTNRKIEFEQQPEKRLIKIT